MLQFCKVASFTQVQKPTQSYQILCEEEGVVRNSENCINTSKKAALLEVMNDAC